MLALFHRHPYSLPHKDQFYQQQAITPQDRYAFPQNNAPYPVPPRSSSDDHWDLVSHESDVSSLSSSSTQTSLPTPQPLPFSPLTLKDLRPPSIQTSLSTPSDQTVIAINSHSRCNSSPHNHNKPSARNLQLLPIQQQQSASSGP